MNKSSHDPENVDLIPFDIAGERLLGDIRVLIKSVRARLAQTTNIYLIYKNLNALRAELSWMHYRMLVSSFINFHPQLIDLKQIKKIGQRMDF